MVRGGQYCSDATFVHPYIALDYAAYLDVSFGILMHSWMYRFISGDPTLIPEVAANYDRVHGTKSIASMTTAAHDATQKELLELQAQAANYQLQLKNKIDELEQMKENHQQDFIDMSTGSIAAMNKFLEQEQQQQRDYKASVEGIKQEHEAKAVADATFIHTFI